MNDLIDIENSSKLKRDIRSKAVVNTSGAEFQQFLMKKRQKEGLESRVKYLEDKLFSIEKALTEKGLI